LNGLTTLFELAKFSVHTLGEREKQTAVEALRTVKATLEELEEGAPLNCAPSADAVAGRANRVPTT
jgi:hypothetical protein